MRLEGGLKRGETLADELKTKEPKDRASQAPARDDGEAGLFIFALGSAALADPGY